MLEKFYEPLAPRRKFLLRVLKCCLVALGVIILGILIGMLGYHLFEPQLTSLQTFYNSALILADMGPPLPPTSNEGRLFIAIYALFCSLLLITIIGIIFTPIIHRLLHHFHSDLRNKLQ